MSGFTIEVTKFSDKVHLNGKALEDRAEGFLKAKRIPYVRNKVNGVDFIIDGYLHVDCESQSVSGSIGDKAPHKCFKYIKKYNLTGGDFYILRPYCGISTSTAEHFEHLESWFKCKIHVLDFAEFEFVARGNKITKRLPYRIAFNQKESNSLSNYKINGRFWDVI